MTSMPFTSSSGFTSATVISLPHPACLVPHTSYLIPHTSYLFFLRIALPHFDLLLRGVLLRGRVDHGAQHLHVGLVPVRRVAPLVAVPRVDAGLARAFVVHARGLDRLEHPLHAQRLHLGGVEVQVLRAPLHFLAGHGPLAV